MKELTLTRRDLELMDNRGDVESRYLELQKEYNALVTNHRHVLSKWSPTTKILNFAVLPLAGFGTGAGINYGLEAWTKPRADGTVRWGGNFVKNHLELLSWAPHAAIAAPMIWRTMPNASTSRASDAVFAYSLGLGGVALANGFTYILDKVKGVSTSKLVLEADLARMKAERDNAVALAQQQQAQLQALAAQSQAAAAKGKQAPARN